MPIWVKYVLGAICGSATAIIILWPLVADILGIKKATRQSPLTKSAPTGNNGIYCVGLPWIGGQRRRSKK